MSEKVRLLIKKSGVSVWLKADFETLWERVKGKRTRPLLRVLNPREKLKQLIIERTPIYEKADFTLQSKKYGTQASMVSKLIKLLLLSGELEKFDD